MDYASIFAEATDAARSAVAAETACDPEDKNAFDCGFAWVTIDGTSGLARWCRARSKSAVSQAERFRLGEKGEPSGWQFWKPGEFRGQSVRIHEAGARGFRDALAKHGICATVGSRLD